MKKSELRQIIKEEIQNLSEKWDTDVKVKSTGKHADKTIAELEKELSTLKNRSASYQEKGEKVPKEIIDKEAELNFAIRAKKHWK